MRGNRGNRSNRHFCHVEDKKIFPRESANFRPHGYRGYSGYSLCECLRREDVKALIVSTLDSAHDKSLRQKLNTLTS